MRLPAGRWRGDGRDALKRRHKVTTAGITLPVLIGLLTAALQAWTASQRARENHEAFEREVAACERSGGRWYRGDCERPEARAVQPK